MISHPIPPVFDRHSKVLILGSFPSVKSREAQFFYGHPQNRFWKVTATVFGTPEPRTIKEKKAFLLSHNIAIWDVIASCDIEGSSDSSIRIFRFSPVRLRKIKEAFVNCFPSESSSTKASLRKHTRRLNY